MKREELIASLSQIAAGNSAGLVLARLGYGSDAAFAEAALSALQADREAVVRECAAVCPAVRDKHRAYGEFGHLWAGGADECEKQVLKLLEPK